MKGTRNAVGMTIPRRKKYKLTGNIVNRLKGKGYTRDKAYDVGFLGHGGTALAKGKEGALSRIRSAGAPVWGCARCEEKEMTIAELRVHWKQVHSPD